MEKTPIRRKFEQVDVSLGVKGSSGEYIVGDGKVVWKTRTLMRRPPEERWDKGVLGLVGGVPWRERR